MDRGSGAIPAKRFPKRPATGGPTTDAEDREPTAELRALAIPMPGSEDEGTRRRRRAAAGGCRCGGVIRRASLRSTPAAPSVGARLLSAWP